MSTEPRRGQQPGDETYLRLVGDRVRLTRAGRGMTRKALARASGVSERYLADLEQGTGNASLLVLRQLAEALAVSIESLVHDDAPGEPVRSQLRAMLEPLGTADLQRAHALLSEAFPPTRQPRRDHLALIGLRGAGKSTVGAAVAAELGRPFVSLAREIERRAGRPIGRLIADGGQAEFRRLERDTLAAILGETPNLVLDAGGGLVTEPAAYRLLRTACFVVWLKAEPAVHMHRVVAQGDTRPMADGPEPMSDLEAILESRSRLYALADATVDTTALSIAEAVAAVTRLARG
jgi:XRE family aerobic/anaerobic benzoate catabolism transcriptional regulator